MGNRFPFESYFDVFFLDKGFTLKQQQTSKLGAELDSNENSITYAYRAYPFFMKTKSRKLGTFSFQKYIQNCPTASCEFKNLRFD